MTETISGLKKIQSLVGFGGGTGAAVGLLCDFFASKGGWIVSAGAGVLAVLLIPTLVLFYKLGKGEFETTWIYKMTQGDIDYHWIWSGASPIKMHGIHLILVFALVCTFLSAKSYAAADLGGVLGKNVSGVAGVQESLGIISTQQAETNEILRKILVIVDGQKVNDPRMELEKIGVEWSDSGLMRAIDRRDLRGISSLFQSNVFIREGNKKAISLAFLRSQDDEMLGLASHYSTPYKTDQCKALTQSILWNEAAAMASFMGGGGGGDSSREVRQIEGFLGSEMSVQYILRLCRKADLLDTLDGLEKEASKRGKAGIEYVRSRIR